jgi:glucose-1-phosphate thymidylyltransferase
VEIVGVIPAAGYATRVQPLACSKEVYPIGGRPVMDYLVDRMRLGGCTQLRVVTRPDKHDVITNAEALGAVIVLAHPPTVSESFLAGMEGLGEDDIVLIGFPDTIWQPEDGYRPLVKAAREGCDIALGLFKTPDLHRSDVVVFGKDGSITGIDVKPDTPRSEWVWGCAAAPVRMLAHMDRAEWPGGHFDLLCREGCDMRGFPLSDEWLDIGTREALRTFLSATNLAGEARAQEQ